MNKTFDLNKTYAVFENTQNGYREAVPRLAGLWFGLFGIFYMIARQLWVHVGIVIALILFMSFMTGMLGIFGVGLFFLGLVGLWVFYITQGRRLLCEHYLQRGWVEMDLAEVTFERPY